MKTNCKVERWRSIRAKKDFENKNVTNGNAETYHLLSPTSALEGPVESYSNSLVQDPIRPPISSTGHLEPPSKHYLSPRRTYNELGRRSVDMIKTRPNHLNLLWCSTWSKDWTLEPSTLYINSELHEILPPSFTDSTKTNMCKHQSPSPIIYSEWPSIWALVQYRSQCCRVCSTFKR